MNVDSVDERFVLYSFGFVAKFKMNLITRFAIFF